METFETYSYPRNKLFYLEEAIEETMAFMRRRFPIGHKHHICLGDGIVVTVHHEVEDGWAISLTKK